MTKKKQRVLIGLSGGVDSAVSAYLLLKQGYEVEGAFMKNWSSTAGLRVQDCPWLQDRQEALRVAAFLGMPLHTLDFEKQYSKNVMDYFFREYKAGRTPNPDVMCNKEIKFKLLYNWAMRNGFDFLATGHYARVARVESHKVKGLRADVRPDDVIDFQLLRSVDEFKDQTYFIYNIKTEQLPHVLFPIGGMKKPEVKKLAERIGLPNAHRKESMGLCFVGKIRLKDFLEQKVGPNPGQIVLVNSTSPSLSKTLSVSEAETSPPKGEKNKEWAIARRGINADNGYNSEKVSSDSSPKVGEARRGMIGKVLGHHSGLHNYTIGQRQGIRVGGGGGPYYVLRKDLKKNILYVTADVNDPGLEVSEVEVHSVNWIVKPGSNFQFSIFNFQFMARYRHQGELVQCAIEKLSKDSYKVKFKMPGKALASGQSIVFYSGKVCLGGGVIT